MEKKNWLSLFEYSGKYNVSISTLRRRIKGGGIGFRLDQGKYFIQDDEGVSQASEEKLAPVVKQVEIKHPPKEIAAARPADTTFSSANELLIELKKAYTAILHEKDDHIRSLREEISNLKTLVRVLEDALPKD